MEIVRKALVGGVTGICCLSIAASCFLGVSYTALKGLDDVRPLTPLVLFVAQGAITLVALTAIMSGRGMNLLALTGAVGIMWLGARMIERTLSSAHFEGYALVLGVVGVLQGGLTLTLFLWRLATASAAPVSG